MLRVFASLAICHHWSISPSSFRQEVTLWTVPMVSAPCKVRPADTQIGTGNAQENVHDFENLPPMFFHNCTTSICRLSI